MGIIKSKKQLEEQARQTLHQICGFSLDEWINLDKPDLQNESENFGIEVVHDVYANEQKAESFIEKVWDKPYSSIDPEAIKRLKKLGGEILHDNDRIRSASLGSTDNNEYHLTETICKKLISFKKVNIGNSHITDCMYM